MITIIVTDTGEYLPTPELLAALEVAKLRKDRQPDLRTREGKRWRVLFKAFSHEKLQEYLRG